MSESVEWEEIEKDRKPVKTAWSIWFASGKEELNRDDREQPGRAMKGISRRLERIEDQLFS